ncbi:hypothetical protein TWF694_009354 [Orbilia ellipsospora]|uniref:Methyltransferase domain-containing protein n=1 Tax=Orbilia ellipsospora TaxID=2528407 RepID=A0AAV9XEM8_9PEZI
MEASNAATEKLSVPSSAFDEMAKKYESGLGGANRDIVQALLNRAKMESPIASESVIHDNACGPAIVTSMILEENTSPAPCIFATDYAQGMIGIASSYKERNNWDSVTVQQMDGQALSFEDGKFTHSLSSLGVFLFPDEKKGLSEMYRTLKPGGWIGVTSWKDVRWPAAALTAYEKLFPDAQDPMKLPSAKNWEDPADCQSNLSNAGFKDVKSEVVRCINRQPSKETGIEVLTGFLRNLSPTAKDWDEETWKAYCQYFKESAEDMFIPASSGDGVECILYAIITTGKK